MGCRSISLGTPLGCIGSVVCDDAGTSAPSALDGDGDKAFPEPVPSFSSSLSSILSFGGEASDDWELEEDDDELDDDELDDDEEDDADLSSSFTDFTSWDTMLTF